MKLTVEMRSADDLSTIAQLAEVLNNARSSGSRVVPSVNGFYIEECSRGLIIAATLKEYFKRRVEYYQGNNDSE